MANTGPTATGRISSRIEGTIETWATRWSARLGDWAGTIIGHGIEKALDIVGKSWAPKLKPMLDRLNATGKIPPELKPLIDEMLNPTGEVASLLGKAGADVAVGSALNRLMAPLLEDLSRGINIAMPRVQVGPDLLLQWWLRHPERSDTVRLRLAGFGFDFPEQDIMKEMLQPIFPSDVVGPAALRNPSKWGYLWNETKKLGLTDEQIELLKEMAYRVPGVQDVIRYAVKEAYNTELTALFRTKEEYPEVAETDARKAGVRPDHLMKEWQAHWDLPSAGQGFQMLHRGIMSETDVTMLLKALDYMPYFRDKLIELSWDVPNRIELRLMARYGLVDKPFLVDALKSAGLHEKYRGIVADMMLAQGLLQDLSAQYAKKWLTKEEVKTQLSAVGLSQDIQDRMYKWIVANGGADRLTKERDLTVSDITKGVKLGYLSEEEATDQLMALGYDESEARYKLAVDVPQQAETLTDEQKIQIDTIRRQRRDRVITREQEITALVQAGIAPALANAYAANDDLRLVKESVSVEAKENLKNQLEAQKTAIDTIRRQRRQNIFTAGQELSALLELGLVDLVAQVYVENDDLRLIQEKVVVPKPVVDLVALERQKVAVDTIRLRRRNRLFEHSQEVAELVAQGIDASLAEAYAANDDLKLERDEAVSKIIAEMSALTPEQLDQVNIIRDRRLEGETLHAEEVKELTTLGLSSLLAEYIAAEDDRQLA